MSRRWLLSLLCLAVLFVSLVQLTRARDELRVNETNSRIFLEKNPAEVSLAVENPSTAIVKANVQLELLDPRDNSIARATQAQSIGRGSQTLRLSLPLSSTNEREPNRVLWYRLHYRLSPQESPAETLADGIISLSEMTPDVFELRVSAAQTVREGNRYQVRVQAAHPITHHPASNVRIDAAVTLEGDDGKTVKLTASKSTDSKGNASLNFALPSRFPKYQSPSAGGELEVTGTKGAIVVQTKGDILVDQFTRILINTDKPLYQPGQVMHVRALVLTPSTYVLANQNTYFKIADPEGAVLYRTAATTSRFGIASADWTIPENTRLGDYRISVGVEGGEDLAGQDVHIGRYELPNFKVNVDLDRKFYLPGQDATVTVKADYLFGQPLLRGNVRVVRESEREWDYRKQKWDISEESEEKGETNADGSFVVKLDLSSLHEDLNDSDYQRFRDVTYAAYFTDPTTNRTEQRRFDVRVTKDPIHVYFLENFDRSYRPELPMKFYVSTFYADGSPARCKVNVSFSEDADNPGIAKHGVTVTTNHYGLAQVSAPVPKEFGDEDEIGIVLSASDATGRKGSESEQIRFSNNKRVRVETDKTIYRPGEPINAVITANGDEEIVVADIAGEAGLIRSERVRLRDGRASITFPFRPEFKNRVSIVAYPQSATSTSNIGTRTVLYPHKVELNVNVRSSRDTYRPGEDAQLNFSVRSSDDRSQESVLGVVVLDQAVVERFRTDQEFGGQSYGFENAIQRFLGLEDQIAGISLRDLQRLNSSQPISSDMDLLAAVLLRNTTNYYPSFYSSDEFEPDAAATLFRDSIKNQLIPLKKALSDRYERTMEYPSDQAKLLSSLSQSQIDFNSVLDPWGMPYHAEFSVDKQNDILTLSTSGADKRYNTPDDFVVEHMSWPYFRAVGEAIDRAVKRYHQRTGKFIRDAATLREEVSSDGLNLEQINDHWDKPYRLDFEVEDSNFVLKVRSAGPDKQFSNDVQYLFDDFIVWKSAIDYFDESRTQIDAALAENLERTKTVPQSDQELHQALRSLGDSYDNLRDPWDRAYYNTFRTQAVNTGRVQIENRATFGSAPSMQANVTPVTQTVGFVVMRSMGPDGKSGTADDFTVSSFAGVISEQPRGAVAPISFTSGVVLSGSAGAIMGVVMDPMAAVVPGAKVEAKRLPAGPTYETSTNDDGRYGFGSLPPGVYELTFDALGFVRTVLTQVLVRPHNIIEINATVEPGTITQTVTVSAEAPQIMTQTADSVGPAKSVITRSVSQQMSTPRLREYFPETLVWQPSIETDKRGHAQINFKLADNITTWKMVVIGSTEDGRIGTTEKDIKAFQPFFVEHDPPRVLTEGDEISLPIVVRNYLSRAQKVDLEIKPESWFALLGPAQKQTNVVAGDARRETFDFRVLASVKDGKQRITARGSDDHDAIEKPVSVHPDGEELSVTASDVLDDGRPLEFEIAQTMIPNSGRGEVKIYPNLLTHVVEGVEAIMERPHGCGEQTISSTYPSLLLLRHYKKSGEGFPLSGLAQRYLNDGYSRLLNYRAEDGGFTYWGSGDSDLALTAYALQFLIDAGDVMVVDQDVIKQAREWLVRKQRPDGSWRHSSSDDGPDVVLTAYVTRVLARIDGEASDALKRALDFLSRETQQNDEPYVLASYALAAIDTKEIERVKPVVEKLRTRGVEEGNTTYWKLDTSTPFHGWGLAGRVETTALVVQALAKSDVDGKLLNRGLLYLLKQKDRYGVWHSTQATVNVLDAMLLLFANNDLRSAQSATNIVVNGNRVQTLQINERSNNPVSVDVSQFLQVGKNRVEIERPDGLPLASVQAVANYYVPWSAAKSGSKRDVSLQVKFDKTEAKINDEITCRVEAARVGFRSYGMLIAEIGIPPGTEVDRSSLQTAMNDWTISQYDVLPDRVVVYVWPKAGGRASFNFKFRPRFGLRAKTAPSILYDYYNPEATVVVPPSVFTVR